MATGVSQRGMTYPDVPAGASQWEAMSGVSPMSPAVGGPGLDGSGSHLPYNVDGARSRIVSNDAQVNIAPAAGAHLMDDWRDVFNWKGSPIPWLLLLTLVMVGFAQFRVQARAGKASGSLALG
jgi:hypothetical protein